MGLNLSTQRSLELRLSVASTVAIGAIGYAALQKHRADTLRSALEDRSSAGGGKPAMPSKIRLIYFDIEGKGEAGTLADAVSPSGNPKVRVRVRVMTVSVIW